MIVTYEEYLADEPVIITAALTGGVHGKEANPNLPETPLEIGRAAGAAAEAGAAVVHLHARDERGERAFAAERFQAIDDAVREHAGDVIIQHSTGATGVPTDVRAQALDTDPPPEMASLDMGPVNRYHHLTSENTRATIDTLHQAMIDRGVKPELETFNDGHRNEATAFLERRSIERPLAISCLFGGGTLTPPAPRNLLTAIDELPEECEETVIATGRHQLPFTTLGVVLGTNVRIGLEDNVYFGAGELAESNAQLVERSASLATLLGRPVASPDEARARLGL